MLWARVAPFAAWILLGSVLTNVFAVVDRYMIVHFANVSAAEALDLIGNYHSSRVVPMLLVSIAAMLAAVKVAERIDKGKIVTIFPDRGEKYLSTSLFV